MRSSGGDTGKRDPMNKRQLFFYAVKKSIPVLLGYIFLGVAFGIVLESAGFTWPWALLISVLVYAGSMQFALAPLLASAAPLSTVALMTLMVNSRHLFYGLSFVDTFKSMGKKYPYMIFSLTDETYSVLCSCADEPQAHADNHLACFLISLLHHFYWVAGSVIGAVAGELITVDTTGIDFSMTALFMVILVDQLRTGGREARQSALIGLALAVVFLILLGADRFLMPTLACTVLTLAIAAQMTGRKEERAHE